MKFLKLLDENFERWLMFALYSHIVAIVFVEVIRRFVFSYSSIWAEETARYAFIYLVWLVGLALLPSFLAGWCLAGVLLLVLLALLVLVVPAVFPVMLSCWFSFVLGCSLACSVVPPLLLGFSCEFFVSVKLVI